MTEIFGIVPLPRTFTYPWLKINISIWLKINFFAIFCNHKIKKNWQKKRFTYMLGNIDDGSWLALSLSSSESGLLINEGPQLVSVDDWGPFPVSLQVEDSHSGLSEVSWMAVFKKWLVSNTPKRGSTYYLFIMILSWCIPPARPRPPGLFLCLLILPLPLEIWPLNFLVFFALVIPYTINLGQLPAGSHDFKGKQACPSTHWLLPTIL